MEQARPRVTLHWGHLTASASPTRSRSSWTEANPPPNLSSPSRWRATNALFLCALLLGKLQPPSKPGEISPNPGDRHPTAPATRLLRNGKLINTSIQETPAAKGRARETPRTPAGVGHPGWDAGIESRTASRKRRQSEDLVTLSSYYPKEESSPVVPPDPRSAMLVPGEQGRQGPETLCKASTLSVQTRLSDIKSTEMYRTQWVMNTF